MHIAFLVPNELPTAQDFVGPWEVLARWPARSSLQLVTSRPGTLLCDTGIEVHVPAGFGDVPDPDVVVVPGGSNPYAAMDDADAIAWLREVAPGVKWFGTVCTGSAVLARAGLLDGRPAATHWAFRDELRDMGVQVTDERVVVSGNVITSAGITAGIDMALTMTLLEHGQEYAEKVQLGLEYDPAPPTDSGTPEKATPEVLAFMRKVLTDSVLARNPARKAGC
jgi:transcriptional regulator GlxA family with amidase domain